MIYILVLFFRLLFSCIELVILLDCIFSFIYPYDSNNKYVRLVRDIADPILEPFRKLQNKYINGLNIDLSPIFALIALSLIRRILFVFII
ncbi:YggT family protein [Clostridium cavendishii DSM 21758]|uniref:YggT family protein n=1 Tax=Clostridium cavendishii DSM 21758 TaxID=1121302 RepID=A0A1M6KNM4_9CLOT|nr:YggT family protein [Clostridium cavendishii]SHJ60598.1 YggT family protein [Clostridium cavendishii DSM 21758]